jgi:Protein of unknown function (DUF1572)
LIEQHYLDDCVLQLRKLKAQAEKAVSQIDDAHFFDLIDPEANSIALIMKHVAGNMRSRWTDFLTTDGEKPDRDRDTEFEIVSGDTRESILARWEDGWGRMLGALTSLRAEDLGKTVAIRGEPHTVVQAINRQFSHYSAHVGQIVLLAKHFAGARWQTLSMPKRRR